MGRGKMNTQTLNVAGVGTMRLGYLFALTLSGAKAPFAPQFCFWGGPDRPGRLFAVFYGNSCARITEFAVFISNRREMAPYSR